MSENTPKAACSSKQLLAEMERQDCTPDSPMPKGATGRWGHEGAYEVHDSQRDNWPAGDIVTMRCRDCGHEWEQELPQ